MWQARIKAVPSGQRFRILDEGEPLSFRSLFSQLESGQAFARWYTATLRDCSFEAYFWEHPPLTNDTIDNIAEFVLMESSSLAGLHANPRAFESHFATAGGEVVLTFPNLGGDALLVVPCPVEAVGAYAHLAAFVRSAPLAQVCAVWAAAARLVRENVSDTPRWLSTAGLGVPWLHLRLDSHPKYYKYRPYATAA
jgi:hypothetical protein